MSALTLAEMDAIAQRASALRAAMVVLKDAEANLTLLKRFAPEKERGWMNAMTWHPELLLKKGNRDYGDRETTIRIDLPYPVVEQQLVYAVDRARRAVIALGGLA